MGKEIKETIKLRADKIAIARTNKEKTGVPIARFIEDAIDEKAQRGKGLDWNKLKLD